LNNRSQRCYPLCYRLQSFILNVVKVICLLLALLLFCAVLLTAGCNNTSPTSGGLKAAIIDQLYLRQPNPDFITQTTQLLESAGFMVDVWQGSDVTVDFYRKMPSMGYRFILFRVHSGTLMELQGDKTVELPDTYIFTAENYTTSRYVIDQLSNKVSYAVMEEGTPAVFAVNSAFIKSAKGAFNRTVILSMGCESFRHSDLEQAFIAKGASVYIGWSDVVTLEHVDKVTLQLVKNYITGAMTVQQGINQVTTVFGVDPYFGSYLKFSPPDKNSRTLKELTE
jgi:hypothetical protein